MSISLIPIFCACSFSGSTCTRTAYFAEPLTLTCDTPSTIEMRGAMMSSAYSSTFAMSRLSDVRLICRIGWSAGFILRNDGGAVSVGGSSGIAAEIAVCTSVIALSMSRFRSKVSVTLELPVPLRDVISSTPAIVVNCRSSGLATDAAMMTGSPPGRFAETLIVGYSTAGRSLIGSARYATTPNSAIAAISKLVAIGRRMKVSEMFTG